MPEVFYDIYRQMEQRRLRWIARVQGLDQARERIGALELAEPGDYLIYDFRQRMVVRRLVVEQTAVEQAVVEQMVAEQMVVQQTVHLSTRQPEPVPAESASTPATSGKVRTESGQITLDQVETRAVLSTRSS